ncbi:uncharacterized protein PG998_005697 [Apiospora kogelbergensis]|uniref:uncharacterized protein n=1 Tax=Apiospora kogelbergensis TaxID=1337665 RepID=UPI0031304AE0
MDNDSTIGGQAGGAQPPPADASSAANSDGNQTGSSGPADTVAAAEEVQPFEENLLKTNQGFEDGMSAYTCKVPRTDAEVGRDFNQLFQYISPEAQQSLRESPARIISIGPQNLGLRGGAGGESSSSSSSSEDGGNNNDNSDNNLSDFNYPRDPVPFPQALGAAVPVEILMNIREYLPPVDELLLSHTHPNVFNTDRREAPIAVLGHQDRCPPTVIRDIWDTWRSNGMDLDLNWALNGPRRQLVGFFKPIHVAVREGRLDVVQQLREWGANIDRLGWTATLTASDPDCHTRFDDATWLAMENLALQRYDEGEPFRNMPPSGLPGVPLCEGCVSVGWVRLLRRYLDPWADAQFRPTTLPVSLQNNETRHRHGYLMRTMNTWMDLVGRVRTDNTPMIDYLADVIARSRAITSEPLPLFAGLGWSTSCSEEFARRKTQGTDHR